MAAVNTFVILSCIIFGIFVLGLHNFLTRNEENGCEMTYMFEYPQFVKIALPVNISRKYSRYGLYAYGEGHMTERLRQMKFSGIPVLFIPGNSGSHKQVRSLASVSLRKTLNSHAPFLFDYFTVDLNEEYSALFGGVLNDQRDFVHHCLHRILQLYGDNRLKPTSVILIGHSMGGMIAKGLFVDPSFDKNLVRIIITLVTPHKSPVLALDSYIASYYDSVNAYWAANRRAGVEGNLSHVTFASIGGGHRDILVRSGLTHSEKADINIVSTAVPAVWLSTDHLCSVWCKELVLVIVRTLFDIINLTTKQVSENVQERKSVFHYHMVQRTAGKRFSTSYHPREVFFDYNSIWNEYLQRQFTFHEPNGVYTETHIMIRLLDDPKHEMLAVQTINVEDKDWVFACIADVIHNGVRMCSNGINLSNETQFLPSKLHRRKFIHLNLADLKRKHFTHVVLRIKPTREMVQMVVDVHSSANRMVSVALPKWLYFMSKSTVLDSTLDGAGYYELALPEFEQAWQAYSLHISAQDCKKSSHHALASMKVPWSKEDVHAYITESVHKPLRLRLQSPKPPAYNLSVPVKVRLILDPQCKYTVRIQSSALDSLGQLARFYSPMLLPYLAAILLLTLRHQLQTLVETGQCVMFHTALTEGAKPYYVLPIARIGTRLLWWSGVLKFLQPLVPLPDLVTLQEQNLDFLMLPIYLYLVAYAVAYIFGLGCWFAVIFSGHTAHKMALRFLAKSLTGTLTLSEWAVAGMFKLPPIVATLLIALNYNACGALSLCVAAAFFFLKLCKMYEDYLEDLFKYSIKLLLGKRKKSNETEENDSKKETGVTTITDKTDETGDDKKDNLTETEIGSGNDDALGDVAADTEDIGDKGDTDKTSVSPDTVAKVDNEGDRKSDEVEEPVAKSSSDIERKSDEVEVPVAKSSPDVEAHAYSLSELHFNFTLLLLWASVTLLNVPCVLVWAHNYRYNVKLDPDPSCVTSFILCFCIGVLWQHNFPKPDLKYYKWVMHSLYILAVLSLTYAPLSLHHLGPIITTAFVVLTGHQVLASLILDFEGNQETKNESASSIKPKEE